MSGEGDTGWMDSLDPNFATIADLWMRYGFVSYFIYTFLIAFYFFYFVAYL
jgi:hypothetical protein